MVFDDLSFHDALILEVREDVRHQNIDFLLDYPVDRETSRFEKRILRFIGAAVYIKKEIPFDRYPVILEVKILRNIKYNFKAAFSLILASNYKAEIITDSGSRIIEYADSDFTAPEVH